MTSRGLMHIESKGEGVVVVELLWKGYAEAAITLNPALVVVTFPAYKNHRILLLEDLGGNNLSKRRKSSR